jgi:hypothetical protein
MPSNSQTTDDQRAKFAEALGMYLRRSQMRPADLTRALRADGFLVHQAQMSSWCNGTKEPHRAVVITMERLLDLVPGLLCRHLGYLPTFAADVVVTDVETALLSDELLTPDQRQVLIATYRALVGLEPRP